MIHWLVFVHEFPCQNQNQTDCFFIFNDCFLCTPDSIMHHTEWLLSSSSLCYHYLVITYSFSLPSSKVVHHIVWLLRTESLLHEYISISLPVLTLSGASPLLVLGSITILYRYRDIRLYIVFDIAYHFIMIWNKVFSLIFKAALQKSDVIFSI